MQFFTDQSVPIVFLWWLQIQCAISEWTCPCRLASNSSVSSPSQTLCLIGASLFNHCSAILSSPHSSCYLTILPLSSCPLLYCPNASMDSSGVLLHPQKTLRIEWKTYYFHLSYCYLLDSRSEYHYQILLFPFLHQMGIVFKMTRTSHELINDRIHYHPTFDSAFFFP